MCARSGSKAGSGTDGDRHRSSPGCAGPWSGTDPMLKKKTRACCSGFRVVGGLGGLRHLAALAIGVGVLVPLASAQEENWTVPRKWCELAMESIRNDFARPTVHARNLHHISAAMYDAWALYEDRALGFLVDYDLPSDDQVADQEEALSFAVYRIMQARFSKSPGAEVVLQLYDNLMDELGYDKSFYGTVGDSPAAWGNRIALNYLWYGLNDGSNEAGDFENLYYEPVNEPLIVGQPGNPTLVDPNRWQPLTLDFFVDQSGNVIPGATPPFLSPEWGLVNGFSITEDNVTVFERDGQLWPVAFDPGPPAALYSDTELEYKTGFEAVAIWSSHLAPDDGVMWDVSPNTIGNAPLPEDPSEWDAFYNQFDGGDWGTGYDLNPVTGEPYPEQLVPRGDYARILAEFWADGPDSELPPGTWFLMANSVSDDMDQAQLRIGGVDPPVDRTEWDVKLYFAMGGAMHDSAISAWSVKGYYDFIRPVSAIRWMGEKGQCSDPGLPSYDENGLNLMPGYIELVTAESSQVGERHEHLAASQGKVAVYAWRGPDFIIDPEIDAAGVGWILAEEWYPYQRPTFVTPNFAGYVSGHSTFSRAGAVMMHSFTGSPWYPNGLGEFVCPQNEYLVFEEGPSVTVTLQWASYYDASDQCSLSRIWGGIHPRVDDIPGRKMGQLIGPQAWEKAQSYWLPPDLCPWDMNEDGLIDGIDLNIVLGAWGFCPGCRADIDGDGVVNGLDLALVISHWNESCP